MILSLSSISFIWTERLVFAAAEADVRGPFDLDDLKLFLADFLAEEEPAPPPPPPPPTVLGGSKISERSLACPGEVGEQSMSRPLRSTWLLDRDDEEVLLLW